jgi:uncharacterized protein YdcH (DUF465 family)
MAGIEINKPVIKKSASDDSDTEAFEEVENSIESVLSADSVLDAEIEALKKQRIELNRKIEALIYAKQIIAERSRSN